MPFLSRQELSQFPPLLFIKSPSSTTTWVEEMLLAFKANLSTNSPHLLRDPDHSPLLLTLSPSPFILAFFPSAHKHVEFVHISNQCSPLSYRLLSLLHLTMFLETSVFTDPNSSPPVCRLTHHNPPPAFNPPPKPPLLSPPGTPVAAFSGGSSMP